MGGRVTGNAGRTRIGGGSVIAAGGTGNAEYLILVDENDNEIGTASREQCHLGLGLRHRAFVLLIDNGRGEVLLQRRGRDKLGGERWDVSATSHVRKGESYETAIARCIGHELGIEQALTWEPVLSYVYTERIGDQSENEYCRLFRARYDGPLRANHSELDELTWMRLEELIATVRADPTRYTSWLREALRRMPQAQ